MPVVFHTADVHLDAPFAFLGSNGQRQRQQVQETFKSLIDRAIDGGCDLLLIAGDLFDSNSPSQKTVEFATAQFRRLTIPICILPGTHDCLSPRSIYRRVSFPQLSPNVFVFGEGSGEQKVYPELGLTVHARANFTNQSPKSPMEGLGPSPNSRWNIALAHGSIQIPGVVDSPDFPIYPEQIARCGMDYVALGHWHSLGNYSQGNVKAYYSGCPEAISFDGQGTGNFIRVQLEEGRQAQVAGEPIGRRNFAALSIDLGGKESLEQVRPLILAKADNELVLKVSFTGLREIGFDIDLHELVGELADRFFQLRIDDQSHVKLEDLSAGAFHANTVIGQFVRLMQVKISEAPSPDDVRLAEDALQLGVALLQGKEVLG